MTEDQLIQNRLAMLQRTFDDIWGKGNIDLFDLGIDPDIVRHNPPFPDIHSLHAYKEYIKAVRSSMSNVQIRIEDVIFQGDLSSARISLTFTHTGMMQVLQIPPTGRRVTMVMGVFARWKEDKIVEEWMYADYLGVLQQLGVLPSQASTSEERATTV